MGCAASASKDVAKAQQQVQKQQEAQQQPKPEEDKKAGGGELPKLPFFGRPVNLRSAHGTHLRAQPADGNFAVDMQSNAPGEWEVVVMESHRDGISIRTAHGRFLRAVDSGDVDNAAETAAEWETWYPEASADGTYTFRSVHGKFLRADAGGEGAICNQADAAGAWEQWTIAPTGFDAFLGRPVNLRSAHNTCVRAHPGDDGATVDLQSNAPAEWESLVFESHRDGVSIRTAHGKFIRAVDNREVNQADAAGEWETWYPQAGADGAYAFRSAHGKFLRADAGEEGAIVNQADEAGEWEQWKVQPVA